MKFNAVAIFKHTYNQKFRVPNFEERVLLIEAPSKKKAEKMALAEFKRYSIEGIKFLGYYEINELYEYDDENIFEVSSLMRPFKGNLNEYLNRFWLNKPESCDKVGWTHVWHNKDNENSCCYNCFEVRKGQLWLKPKRIKKMK